jgi:predicted DNA-binding WGR domain protein
VAQVFAKDWYEDREKVLNKILAVINNTEEPEIVHEAPDEEAQMHEPEKTEESNQPVAEEKEPVVEKNSIETVRLISTENNSHKFWEAFVEENNLVITYGKVNTKGQKIIKPFDTKEQAETEKQKLVRQKLGKGYKEDR